MNKKITKLMSVFIIAGVVGTGAAGIVGCTKIEDEHTHTAGTTWEHDETNHWNLCTGNDGEKMNTAAHADADKDGKCDVCNYQMSTPEPSHKHTAGTDWKHDETNHWHECTANDGEKMNVAAHKDDNKDGKCDVCGYQMSTPVQKYTVSFNLNYEGATGAPAAQEIDANGVAAAPTAPVREGYTFGGWYTEAGCTTAYDFTAKVTANVELYAKWTAAEVPPTPAQKYTVSFNLNYEGATGAPESQEIEADGVAVAPATAPVREGYTFEGWYTDAGCTTAYDFTAKVTANVELYAKWTAAEVPPTPEKYTVSFNLNYEGATGAPESQEIEADGVAAAPTAPVREGYTFEGWYTDAGCTAAYDFTAKVTANVELYAKWTAVEVPPAPTPTVTGVTVTAAGNVTSINTGATLQLSAAVAGENNPSQEVTWTVSEGATVSASGLLTAGSEAGTVTVTATSVADPTKSNSITITITAASSGEMEVTYEIQVDRDLETGKSDSDRRVSIFTLGANTEVRNRTKNTVYANEEGGAKVSDAAYTKSIKLGGSANAFIINAPEKGTFTMHIQNGSSGTKDWQKVILTKPDGSTEEIKYAAFDGSPMREVVIEFAEKGEYKITRTSGTSDIFYAKYTATVKNTPVAGIEVAAEGTTEYFVGQTYTTYGIGLNKIYAETMRTEPIELDAAGLTIDTSAVDNTKAGVYTVKISYTEGGKTYEKTINVTYYAVKELQLGRNKIVSANNSYNGIYVNHHLRELYIAGEKFSTDGLSVHVLASNDPAAEAKDFLIADGYTVSVAEGSDLTTPGKHSVTVTLDGTNVTSTFDIYVIDGIADLSQETALSTYVDATVADGQVGIIGDKGYQFQTIHQAIDFIESCGIPDGAIKTINLAAGIYNEKLEINVPNVEIIGAGTSETGYSMIEWDSLYGIEDESGFLHTTDSTATLNVREKATGFSIKNVIVSNYYNSLKHFDERLGVGYAEHRALAMLVQADKVVIDSCSLLGYQDTVEFFTGRQLVKDSYICGYTDFIFGTNNTTYFTNCTIESIAGKDAASHGGYITAFKGVNKSGTKVTYGAIFDKCNFIAEEGSAEGKTAIGRPWGADAAVMIMNSQIGAHVSKTAYDGGSRDLRYVAMGGNEPQNAQFTEYNNTGAGAITESQTYTKNGVTKNTVTVITDAAVAANYNNLEVIFGTTNGEVSYGDAWDGTAGAKITSETYNFAEISINETRTFNEVYAGKLELQEGGKARWNGNSIQTTKGTVIKVLKQGQITVEWFGSGYGAPEDGVITYKDGYATLELVNDGKYITKITVDFSTVPAEKYTVSFNLNYEGATGAPAAQEIDANGVAVAPEAPAREGYTFDGWYTDAGCTSAYDFAAAVTANVELYAKWTAVEVPPAPETYTVTWIVDGTAVETDTVEKDSKPSYEGKVPTKPADKRYRYTFAGWKSGVISTMYKNVEDMPAVTADVTYRAVFTVSPVDEPVQKYTVSFNLNYEGATGALESQEIEANGVAVAPANVLREGYKFEGWYTDAGCTSEYDFNTAVTADVELYAKWTVWAVDLTPDENGIVNISSVEEFVAFRQLSELPGTTYRLTADIDLDGVALEAPKAVIGTGVTFDGQGYKIMNASYTNAAAKTGVLCASINGGTVTNVKFLACAISSANESAGLLAGLAEGTSTLTKIEFNSCSASTTNNYVGLLFARNGSANGNITVEEITAKNGCITSCAQYGGLLMGDMTGTSTVSFKNLDVAGEFAGSSGNGSFIAGRTRAGATVSVEHAVISAVMPAATSIGIFSGNGNANLTIKNVLIVNTNKPDIYQANKAPTTKVIENLVAVTGVTVNEATATNGENTPAYLRDTLGFDFTNVWMTEGEGDAKYRPIASSTNVKSPDAVISAVKVSTNNVKTRYKKGETFSATGLGVMGAYSDGVQLVLNPNEGYTVDSTAFNGEVAGEYTITVKSVEDATKTATYKVIVAEQTGFEVIDSHMDHVYLVGDSLDTANLVVKSIWSDGIHEKLAANEYTIDAASYDMTTVGTYNVAITNGTYAAQTVKINVLNSIPQPVDGKVYVNVSAAHTGANGELVNGVETFTSVKDAINFYETIGLDASITKVIRVGEGVYEDKITTDLANLVLIGEGVDKSVLTYSAVESTVDPVTGSMYGLKCATLHVKGEGFRAYNIAIRNDFDYKNDNKKEASPQGLALTIEGDKAVIENCYLYGNQDTLYLKAGRAYFKNTQIDGNIDFIFGEAKGLAYFDACTIKAINKSNGQEKNNGYVTAMKADDGNKPDYGYIFNNCTFTDDGTLLEGSMSLGRPWGKRATVAYIGCSFTKAYSKLAYDGSAKSRWFEMSGNSPEGADFCEYGSTGEGAITEAVKGGSVLTADQAANYTKANIFAAKNGLCTWEAAWDCDAASAALVELAGATVAPTEIYVSETSVSLEVGKEQNLYITTAPWNANDKAVTVTVADPTVATWSNGVLKALKAGETTITVAKDGLTSKTIAVTVTAPQSGSVVTTTYTYDYAAIKPATISADGKTPLTAADFTGVNSFLTYTGSGKEALHRSDGGKAFIEIKNDVLQVTFKGTGTITVGFCSTGSSNNSRLGLLDAGGKYIAATNPPAEATLVADAEAGAYECTGTSTVELTFTITEAGTYTIASPSTVTGRGCRLMSVVMVDNVPSSAPTTPTTKTYTYDYAAITPVADKAVLTQAEMTGANAFLTIANEKVTYRVSAKCIENKDGGLQVTFNGTGTITITYCSTSKSNISRLGLLDADGKYVAASTVGEGATLVTDAEAGAYEMGDGAATGSTDVTLTFTVTKAGTYTINCPSSVTNRGARIKGITMVDNA